MQSLCRFFLVPKEEVEGTQKPKMSSSTEIVGIAVAVAVVVVVSGAILVVFLWRRKVRMQDAGMCLINLLKK